MVLADYTVPITRGNAEENKRALLMEHLQAEHCYIARAGGECASQHSGRMRSNIRV